jgi:hypothetical protein
VLIGKYHSTYHDRYYFLLSWNVVLINCRQLSASSFVLVGINFLLAILIVFRVLLSQQVWCNTVTVLHS